MLQFLAQSAWMNRIGWALVHSLWQFALLALAVIVLVWLVGVTALAARPLLSWRLVRRLRRTGVSAVAARGGSLLARMRRIAGCEQTPRIIGGASVFGVTLAAIVVFVLVTWGAAPAAEQATDASRNANAAPNKDRSGSAETDRLITAIKDRGEQYGGKSARAAKALGELGTKAERAIRALVEALGDERADSRPKLGSSSRRVGEVAAEALVKIGRPAVPALAHALHNDQETVRQRAADTLRGIGLGAAQAAGELKQLAAGDKSDAVRFHAVESYAAVEADEDSVVNVLVAALHDKSADVRGLGTRLLGRLGPKAAAAVPALMAGLNDRGTRVRQDSSDSIGTSPMRCDVAETLGLIGKPARAALPQLRIMMASDREAEVDAALAICRIDPRDTEALNQLIRWLDDVNRKSYPVDAPAYALGEIGPRARRAVPALVKALRHPDGGVRGSSADALGKIGGAEVVGPLVFALRDPDGMVRRSAAESLGRLGKVAAPAVPALVKTEAGPSRPNADQAKALAGDRPARQSSPAMVSSNDRDRAIKPIEKSGGKVERQDDKPDKPDYLVYLWGDHATDKDLASIKQLDVHDSKITDEGLRLLDKMTQLEKLYLWNTSFTDAGLSHLPHLKHLRLLNISGTKITDKGLQQLSQITTLEMISLDDTKVTDTGLAHLRQLKRLWLLGLNHTAVSDAGLPQVAVFDKLDCLDLDGTLVTDAGIKQLSPLKSLTRLSLEDTEISDAGIAALAKACPRLKELSVSGTGITDSGLVHLKELADLGVLKLARTNITDKGLAEIARLSKLYSLDLTKTKVTEEGVKQLEKQHPFPFSKSSPYLIW